MTFALLFDHSPTSTAQTRSRVFSSILRESFSDPASSIILRVILRKRAAEKKRSSSPLARESGEIEAGKQAGDKEENVQEAELNSLLPIYIRVENRLAKNNHSTFSL